MNKQCETRPTDAGVLLARWQDEEQADLQERHRLELQAMSAQFGAVDACTDAVRVFLKGVVR